MIIKGVVIYGEGDGTKLGFPTANLKLTTDSERALTGIYAVWVSIKNQPARAGILVSGVYQEDTDLPRQEVYVLNFDGDLYGKELVVEVVQKIRDVVRTADTKQLKKMIANDINKTREILKII